MDNKNFQFSFITPKNKSEVFAYLINPENWWAGLFDETIVGKSIAVNDEFSFRAGDGVHYSNQKLIVLEADKKIVWEITESNLSFLKNTSEWTGTKISFDIEQEGDQTKVTFTHQGLVPEFECYGSCSNAWTRYLQNLKAHFN